MIENVTLSCSMTESNDEYLNQRVDKGMSMKEMDLFTYDSSMSI